MRKEISLWFHRYYQPQKPVRTITIDHNDWCFHWLTFSIIVYKIGAREKLIGTKKRAFLEVLNSWIFRILRCYKIPKDFLTNIFWISSVLNNFVLTTASLCGLKFCHWFAWWKTVVCEKMISSIWETLMLSFKRKFVTGK